MAYLHTNQDLAKELRSLAQNAQHIESFVNHAEAVLISINHGGLLDAAPSGSEEWERHSAATNLLAHLLDDLRRLADLPGTDLSISLSVIADGMSRGRG